MQEKLQRALATLDGEGIKGEYRSLEKLGDDAKKDLAASGASFDEDKKSLRDSAAFNEWPKGRGVFSSADRSLIVFINEHEHLRIISAQAGSNLSSALQRFRRGLKVCLLRFCSNLSTRACRLSKLKCLLRAMRASVI